MTETQAKAATAEAPVTAVVGEAGPDKSDQSAASQAKADDAMKPDRDGAPSTGRASVVGVGRATVPGDSPASDGAAARETPSDAGAAKSGGGSADNGSADDQRAGSGASDPTRTTDGDRPKFTRAPGMPPPPDRIPAQPVSAAPASGSASVPHASVSGAGAGAATTAIARASVKAPSGAFPTLGSASTGASRDHLATQPIAAGTARVAEAVRQARAAVGNAGGRGPRRARLHLKRVDPWSVMKFSFAVSLVLFVVAIVATSVLYLALDTMGVFNSVNKALTDMFSANGSTDGSDFKITAKGIIGGAALLGAVNVVLFTALATLGAFIYNVCADLVGGIELTLAEKD
jgi:hypothetical protein